MTKILVIDDEAAICSSLKFALEDKYAVITTTDPMEGVRLAQDNNINLVLLDLKLGDVDGIYVLEELKKIDSELVIIIMTAYGSIPSSVEAVKKGAYTYLTKPLNTNNLLEQVEQALKDQEFFCLNNNTEDDNINKHNFNGIIGQSPKMKNVFKMIEKVKDVNTNVLISGESGTGKELVARAIHYSGKRKEGPLEIVNCAAIPENLLESELFGHKKGSFTGALSDKAGKFKLADKGTIFLDEVGEMPMPLQSKLLRVLQQREITPLGETKPVKLDVRVISASNRDLKEEVKNGTFRDDLYYRLKVVEINIPPLRERRKDISFLIKYFMEKYNKEFDKNIKGITSEARKYLLGYDYQGNVRELENIIEAAMVVSEDEYIDWFHLPEGIIAGSDAASFAKKKENMSELIGKNLEEVEKYFIKLTLKQNQGHRKKTAEMLGLSEKGLRNKIKRYNIDTDE
ncbi:sigma-54-dependent transcriptional regulator [Natranaerofaba carboxydovora]|uniref:sigma-54-dependent transcriptional regulator n=1 Tax=Natranaerofaba carboxydovora TaxID=2742683 RepID=UPI001F12B920|nr:sigma-54 dependent transcriptional regulator [Natranaerofaba carboxydovora]UMZ73711.1 Transcriptional regulatory protein ZraR [Natranaerofaba carboxydovora]